MATVVDVAKQAGVSVATVSRVLNSDHIVTKEKREKVLKAMEELKYEPRTTLRNTKAAEKRLIIVFSTVIIEEVLSGIYDMASELNYEVMVSYTNNKRNLEIIKGFENQRAAGVILLNAHIDEEEIMEISSKIPLVQTLQPVEIPDAFHVAIDDERAAYDSVKKLILQGKKCIGFIGVGGSEDGMPYFSRERYRGYRRALDDFKIAFDSELVKYSDISYDGGIDTAKKFLEIKEKPDAVFSVQDIIAVACINVFKEAGLKIPQDIAVSGFDNTEIAQICSPQLTTVEQPFYEIGFEAMGMLDSLIKGSISTGRRLLINHKLIERESTIGKNKV